MPKASKKEKKVVKEDSDDDDVAAAAAPDSDDEPLPPPPKAKKNAFAAALMSDSEDEEEEEQAEEDLDFGDKKKKKDKKEKKDKKAKADEPEDDAEDLAVFGEKKKKKDKKEGKEAKDGEVKEKKKKKWRGPVVCEVLEVSPIPKKDKLRVCKVRAAEGAEPIAVVTNATNVVAGKKFVIALPGVTTGTGVEVKESKVGGVESFGMFCGPKDLEWPTDVLDETVPVMVDDAAEVGAPMPSYDEAVAAFEEREKAAAQAKASEASKGKDKKGKKKGGGAAKEDDEDLDALLGEFGVELKDEPAAKKKGKKGKNAKDDDGEDFEAALKEFEPPARVEEKEEEPAKVAEEPASKSAAQKKKDKKKGKAGAADDDEDLDAILAEEGTKAAAEPEPAAAAPAPAAAAAAPAPAAAAADAGDDDDEANMDAKTLANRRKKDKKKAKNAAVGGAGFFGGGDSAAKDEAEAEGEAAAAATEEAEASGSKAKGKAKGKAKAESAAVKRMREEIEARRALEEERAKFEAEQRKQIEEEERRIKEEEDREAAERERKRQGRLDKIAKQKADGTYMSKAEKARTARAAMLRKQFGFDMDGDKDDEAEAEPEKQAAKRPIATKKKKFQGGKTEDAPKEEAKAQVEEPKKDTAKAAAKQEDEDDDDWEAEAVKLEEENKAAAEKKAAKAAAKAAEKEEKEEGSGSDDESGSGSGSGSDSDSDSDSDSSSDSFMGYRSPILVIMGHVDTGKTKLLDKIRKTNVQDNEAGGITQQIGATFFPDIALMEQTKKVDDDFEIEVPGMMVIDTPGHESFNNLRKRGSSLCDMAILVIDIMHGLEPQTIESINLLKKRRCFFIIALNKIDVCYAWKSNSYTCIKDALQRQHSDTMDDFNHRFQAICTELNTQGLNVALYWENEDPSTTVSIVPTSAMTGEGVPDLLYLALRSAQTIMPDKLEVEEDLQATVIEVRNIEGLGTTIDIILINGTLREGDQIVIAGINGAIVTNIRALLTPQPMKEIRVKSEYIKHSEISTSMGVKICAPGLEDAVAGAELMICREGDDIEDVKEEVMEGFDSILCGFEKQTEGVYVKASTLGSLEALLSFLVDMKIPVFDVGIGEVHKKDVKKACIMKEKKHPEYAVILAFDVKTNSEARAQADKDDVQIMEADIIYNLKDKFEKYMEKVMESKKSDKKAEAIFPAILKIDKQYIFRKTNPIILGCTVKGGQLRIGTPLCLPDKDNLCIGRVGSIEKDRKQVQVAKTGEAVCVKIEQTTAQTHIMYGRHFDHTSEIYSMITRASIDVLKELYKDEMKREDWALVLGMKKVFKIE